MPITPSKEEKSVTKCCNSKGLYDNNELGMFCTACGKRCQMIESPTWEDKEREAYEKWCSHTPKGVEILTTPKSNLDYWISRIKLARKEERDRWINQPANEHDNKIRAATLEEIKEIIICSAVRMPDGYIVRGHRHNDAIHTASGIPRYAGLKCLDDNQGFVTSRNRYVTRKEAYEIQIAAGIPSVLPLEKHPYLGKECYSEDLY